MQIEGGSSRASSSKRIFVVERDEVVRSALRFILESDHETLALTDLEQAYAASRGRAPDLVLLGLPLLGDQGVRALNDVRARLPGVKILLVADSRRDPLAQACLAAGADGVLGKPITHDSVRDQVDALLERQKPFRLSLAAL